ncbi:aldehyde dehydrogenase family protein [Streptomyces sp. 110]|uniref:Aldehyde dehydrogenase family protein n=1 Tax=Streptomyces endocoffeicus TaxID=2898945 RepID=A0ABS1Q4U2_9ACTN|nr:aldehyde dehydrogenase family protein [Streptomyces endocoffeicus]MBL1119688.1 aldehyde dehydrogenase family protein [Streptomyces endocoffeicus]
MTVTSVNPINGAVLATIEETTPRELEDALAAASAAAPVLRAMSAAERGRWMRAVAAALDHRSAELVRLARHETGLPDERLTGEMARTTTQLRLLAEHAETGRKFEPAIDRSDQSWMPAPRPDLRSIRTGLGVVLVFAASNFPFAFSVPGGDTASAWAAGCPGIVTAGESRERAPGSRRSRPTRSFSAPGNSAPSPAWSCSPQTTASRSDLPRSSPTVRQT